MAILILDLDKRSRIGQNITQSRRVVKNATEIAIFNRQYVDLDIENWSHFSFLNNPNVFDFATNIKRQIIEAENGDIRPSVFPSVRYKAVPCKRILRIRYQVPGILYLVHIPRTRYVVPGTYLVPGIVLHLATCI